MCSSPWSFAEPPRILLVTQFCGLIQKFFMVLKFFFHFVNFLSQYQIIIITWFWEWSVLRSKFENCKIDSRFHYSFTILFQVCDEIEGNDLDLGVSIFGQPHVMQGRKSDPKIIQLRLYSVWPWTIYKNVHTKSVFSTARKFNHTGTSIRGNGNQSAFQVNYDIFSSDSVEI